MITKDFKIDFKNKTISYNPAGSGRIYTINELYSYLQDLFDEPGNMAYEIPMAAQSQTDYILINGWTIDEIGLKHLTGNLTKYDNPPNIKTNG